MRRAADAGCPNCGTVNLPAAKFCSECATPLVRRALLRRRPRRARRSPLASSSGRAAGVPSAGSSASCSPTWSASRRFAEERDAEDVRDTLTRYFDMAREVIERYGGTVEKFIGDAVMAVWGAPVAHEDDAERAVRAALDLVDARAAALAPGIQARAGVLTGEAAVTIGATNQGMVAGDLVNTASRLQSVAEPGTVLVGEATQRAAERRDRVRAQSATRTSRARRRPSPAWRALRVVARASAGAGRAETLEAPFVGRDEEMRLLKELFHATGRERRPRLVSVIGPGGIGKSRLAWEFLKYIDGLFEVVWWHDGRCPAYGEGITFWALGEMVRERAGLRETDDEATTRERARRDRRRARARRGRAARGSSVRCLRCSASRRGVDAAAAVRGLANVLRAAGRHEPGGDGLRGHAFRRSGPARLHRPPARVEPELADHVVTLARPELLEKRPNWGAGKRSFTSIYLEPLSERGHARAARRAWCRGCRRAAIDAIVAPSRRHPAVRRRDRAHAAGARAG